MHPSQEHPAEPQSLNPVPAWKQRLSSIRKKDQALGRHFSRYVLLLAVIPFVMGILAGVSQGIRNLDDDAYTLAMNQLGQFIAASHILNLTEHVAHRLSQSKHGEAIPIRTVAYRGEPLRVLADTDPSFYRSQVYFDIDGRQFFAHLMESDIYEIGWPIEYFMRLHLGDVKPDSGTRFGHALIQETTSQSATLAFGQIPPRICQEVLHRMPTSLARRSSVAIVSSIHDKIPDDWRPVAKLQQSPDGTAKKICEALGANSQLTLIVRITR